VQCVPPGQGIAIVLADFVRPVLEFRFQSPIASRRAVILHIAPPFHLQVEKSASD
jgi:hypothetical protein